MYSIGTWFVSGICVYIPCIKETTTMMMIIIIIIIGKEGDLFYIAILQSFNENLKDIIDTDSIFRKQDFSYGT
jgi:hypothetical protein